MKNKIKELIEGYASVYSRFEDYQKDRIFLPGGDQKTGVIAEYYAKCYIESLEDISFVEYAKSGNCCDLIYGVKGYEKQIKVQVKGVSAHSKTRTIAPLNLKKTVKDGIPFDELFLIDLDREFKPIAFYINSYDEIIKRTDKESVKGSKMKGQNLDGKKISGSSIYNFENNKNGDLLKAIYN